MPAATSYRDSLRAILVEERLTSNAPAEAARLIGLIDTSSALLPMLVLDQFDRARANVDPITLLQQTLAREDRNTADTLAAMPANVRSAFDRVEYLQVVGRNEEAAGLVEPFSRDIGATVAADRTGMWLINSGANALIAAGRPDEAMRLMSRLTALSVTEHPELIGPIINRAEMLVDVGRPAEALDLALRTDREMSQHANDYGRASIARNAVCALAALARPSEAASWMTRLREARLENPMPLIAATLCLGDLDAAEALVISALRGGISSRRAILLSLQDYRLTPTAEAEWPVNRGLSALRDRPAVREALRGLGRTLSFRIAG